MPIIFWSIIKIIYMYLTDFGAAWDYSVLEPPAKHRIQALEVCAFGWLYVLSDG
jgi:hypothetical protein